MSKEEASFEVSVDHDRKIITIQGMKFTFEFFNALGFAAKGTRFEIGDRYPGGVTLHTLPRADALSSQQRGES